MKEAFLFKTEIYSNLMPLIMKTFIALLFMVVIVSSLCAQETKPEAMPSQPQSAPEATPARGTAPAPDSFSTEPLQLIPDTPTTVPKPSGQSAGELPVDSRTQLSDAKDKLNKSKAVADADELKERIRFREIKTRAVNDGKVQQQLEVAQAAGTTREKIAAMKQYYNLLFARMLALDGTLKSRIEKSKKEALARVDQTSPVDLNPQLHGKNW